MSMRTWFLTGTTTLLLLPAVAGLTASAQVRTVATIDMAKVLRNYSAVRDAVGTIKAKKDEFQKQIDALQEEIRAINTEIQQDKEKGKDTKDKEAAKRKKIFDLQQKYQKLRDQLDRMEAEEFDQIKDRIRAQVTKLATAKGADLVIEKQWLYAGATMDLTEDLLQTLGGSSAPKGGSKKPKAPAGE